MTYSSIDVCPSAFPMPKYLEIIAQAQAASLKHDHGTKCPPVVYRYRKDKKALPGRKIARFEVCFPLH